MRRFLLLSLLVLNSACTTNPSVVSDTYQPNKISDINAKLGVEYMRRGQNEVALRKLQQSLEQDPSNPRAHNALALLYERLGQDALVEPHYQQALDIHPHYSSAHNNYGSYLCRTGRIEDAEAAFKSALENPLYTTPERVHTNAGLCSLRAGRKAQAGDHFRTALQQDPNIPTALYQMANLSAEAREFDTAYDYYQRYLAIAKQTPETLWLGIRLAREREDKNAEASYALLLKSRYPDSEEARLAAE